MGLQKELNTKHPKLATTYKKKFMQQVARTQAPQVSTSLDVWIYLLPR